MPQRLLEWALERQRKLSEPSSNGIDSNDWVLAVRLINVPVSELGSGLGGCHC